MNRVVVTGVGVISPLGNEKEEFWSNLVNGVSGVGFIEGIHPEVKIGAQVKNFDPENYLPKKKARHTDRADQFAVAAAYHAIKDAELALQQKNNDIGIILGQGHGGLFSMEQQYTSFFEKGASRVSPFTIPMIIPFVGEIAIAYGLNGPQLAICTACAAGNHAVMEAYRLVKEGDARVMLAGGAEAVITPFCYAAFNNAGALTKAWNNAPKKASRPFDAKRDGFVMGEGSAMMILENLESALQRDANIYAEVVGYGETGDAYHITNPDPDAEQQARAMQLAMQRAGIRPEEVDYVNAHGTSTPLNDRTETLAIKRALGKSAYSVPVSSTKSMTGHLLGAAGALESVVCVLAIERGIIPPTINYEFKDPECDLNYTPNKAAKKEVKVALNNSFGFGGPNATSIFRKYEF